MRRYEPPPFLLNPFVVMGSNISKARKKKAENDNKRLAVTLEKVKKIVGLIEESAITTTEACREVGLSVDKYYRTIKKLKD